LQEKQYLAGPFLLSADNFLCQKIMKRGFVAMKISPFQAWNLRIHISGQHVEQVTCKYQAPNSKQIPINKFKIPNKLGHLANFGCPQ